MSRAVGAAPRSLRMNSVVTASSGVIRGLLGFAASLVITRSLSTGARGTYSFTTNATGLIVMLAGIGVPSALTRAKARGQANTDELYRASWLLGMGMGAVASALFLLAYELNPGQLFDGVRPLPALIVALIVPPMIVLTYWTVVAYLDDRLLEFGVATVTASALMLAAAVALALAGALSGLSIVGAWAVTTLVPVIVLLRKSQVRGAWGARSTARDLLRFGIRANVATVALILTWRLDVFFVKGLRGSIELAYYVVAVGVAEIILQVAVSFRIALTPLQGNTEARGRLVETIAVVTRLTVGAGLLVALSTILLARPFVTMLFGERYSPSTPALIWLVPGVVALVAQGPLIDYLLAENALSGVTRITLAGLGVNTALNVVLLQRYNFVVAAASSTVAYAATFLACLTLFSRRSAIPMSALLIPRRADLRRLTRRGGS